MKSEIKFLLLIVTLMFCNFLHSQDTLEEIITFVVPEEYYGHSKISARYPASDIDNDGFSDFIMHYRGMGYDEEKLYFYYGCSHPDSLVDIIIDIPFDYCGGTPSYCGDLNGDGWKDLLVPIIRTDDQYIYIFFGEENLVPDFDNPDILLNSADYAFDTWELGWNGVNTGTDFNGDGYDDIYAHGDGPSLFFNGQVDIFFGGENMDTEVDFHIMGEEEDWLSQDITAGDINGDGYDDLICSRRISEVLYNYEIYLGGEVMDTIVDYVISSEPSRYFQQPIADGDMNGDDCDELIISNKLYLGNQNFNTIPYMEFPNSGNERFFCDINNDGLSDFATSNVEGLHIYIGSVNITNVPSYVIYSNNTEFARKSCNLNDFNGDGNNDILINLGYPYNRATVYTIENLVSLTGNNLSPIESYLTNYPNPFNPVTTISYDLPATIANPVIEIFNIKGEKVRTFNCKNQIPIIWDGTDNFHNQVSSGIYLYRIKTDEGVLLSKKMLLLK